MMDNRTLAGAARGLAHDVATLNREVASGVLQRMAEHAAAGTAAAAAQRVGIELAIRSARRATGEALRLTALYPEPGAAAAEDRAALDRLDRQGPA